MEFIKMLFIALVLVILGMLAFSVFGFFYSLLWYVLWFSVVGIAGYAGYKWLTKDSETAKLGSKSPTSIADVGNYKRALKEYVNRK